MYSEKSYKKLGQASKVVYSTRYVYKSRFVEKSLFNQLNVKKLLSVHKGTSPGTLYSDVVKIPSNRRGISVLDVNPSVANKAQSKTVRDYDKCVVNIQSKVSINDVSRRSVNAQNIANHIEQTYVCSDITSRTNVVPKLEKNNVNITEQDCNDFVHDNRFAVLCVDSSEDEGDSLEFDTVNNPDTFCTVRGCQGGESVGNDTYLGKIPFSFTGNSAPNVSDCPNVVETCPTKIHNIGRQFNRTNHIPTTANSETLSIDKGTVTGVGGYNGDTDIDKYCLEIQSTVKCEKIRIAKTNHANAKCIRQNTYPIIWLYSHLWVKKPCM